MDRQGETERELTRRILFLSHYGLPHLGGIEVAIDAVARELCRRGHEVVHLASDADNQQGYPDNGSGPVPESPYRRVRVPALNALERRAGVPYPIFGPALAPALRREVARADVVHAHGLLYMTSFVALALARLAGRSGPAPLRILTEHVGHVAYESRALDRAQAVALSTIGRASARAAEAIVTLNEKVRAEVAQLAPGIPIEHIPNGVDTSAYRPADDPERRGLRRELAWDDRPRVLFVGRLVAKKGVQAAIDAAVAADQGFRLVIVGPGKLPQAPPPGVDLLGPLPPHRVAQLYRAADAFLLPSRGEGFPITAQEAMASGLPVVLGSDPAYEPHVAGAGTGVQLVAPEGEAIAAALLRLLGDPEARARAGASAAAHARRAFSWASAADAHERLYELVLERRGGLVRHGGAP